MFAKRRQFDPRRNFSTWLWRIALNACFAESRRMVRLATPDGGATASELRGRELAPADGAIAREQAEQVRQALARLSDDCRAVVVLREYEGLKYREIAEVLEIPEGTAKWRMTEALTQLAEELASFAADRPDAPPVAKR